MRQEAGHDQAGTATRAHGWGRYMQTHHQDPVLGRHLPLAQIGDIRGARAPCTSPMSSYLQGGCHAAHKEIGQRQIHVDAFQTGDAPTPRATRRDIPCVPSLGLALGC